jgi:phage-related protein
VAEADKPVTWRVMYRIDQDAVIIADVFAKKTRATPQTAIDVCKRRLRDYDELTRENK